MMNSLLRFFFAGSALWAAMASMTLTANIVVVDMNEVFQSYIRTQEAEQQMQASIQNYRQGQEQLRRRFQEGQQAFNEMRERSAEQELDEAQRIALAEEAAEMLNQLRQLEQELRQEDANRQQQIEEQGRRMRQRIIDEIEKKIVELAAEREWTLVLDKSGTSTNGVSLVLHSSPGFEVTSEVIQALNQPILRSRAAEQNQAAEQNRAAGQDQAPEQTQPPGE